MSKLGDRIQRLFLVRAVTRYIQAQGPNWAVIIAWNLLFALFPIVLVTATVIGLVLQNPDLARGIEQQVAQAFPKDVADQITTALTTFKEKSGIFAVVGFVGLLWSGSALFGAIEQGLNALYACRTRGFIRQKLMAFGMILLFTALAVPLVMSSSLLPALESLPVVPHLLTTGPAALLLQIAAGALVGSVLFLAIYYVVPHRRQRLRHVLPGAVAAGILLEALSLLFPLYFKLSGGFASYGATFALFFLLLTYVYLLAQILMIGGAVNAEYGAGREPAPSKEPAEQEAMRPTDMVGRRAEQPQPQRH